MKKTLLLICSILAFCIFPRAVFAGGATFTNQYIQVAQSESRAVIIYDGKKETILDSFTFNVNPISHDNFVWVIPVPSRPEVEPIKDEIFVKFEKLTENKLHKETWLQKLLYFDIDEEKSQPTSVFTRPVDIWKFDIVEPGSYEKLNDAVQEMGYFIPKQGRPIVREYVDKKWYFIVAYVNALHIQMNASDSVKVTGAHTLPLKITFETDRPIYPLKLASIPSDFDSEYAGLGYVFGSSSESVLGEKDEKVDELLSEPSKNKFPSLPLDYMNLKVDLFILGSERTTADGFTIAYGNWIQRNQINFEDLDGKKYVDLPNENMYLTRIFSYTPLSQAGDVTLKSDTSNRKVNAAEEWKQYIKIGAICTFVLFACVLLKSYAKRNLIH